MTLRIIDYSTESFCEFSRINDIMILQGFTIICVLERSTCFLGLSETGRFDQPVSNSEPWTPFVWLFSPKLVSPIDDDIVFSNDTNQFFFKKNRTNCEVSVHTYFFSGEPQI